MAWVFSGQPRCSDSGRGHGDIEHDSDDDLLVVVPDEALEDRKRSRLA